MTEVVFLLNGTPVHLRKSDPSETLLNWLREDRGLLGTKEGCNEGDCGACTVMVTDENGARSINACILFLSQIHGKAVRTVEGMSGPNGELHPIQSAMIKHHASQCGFCTPGFVVALVVGHTNGARNHDEQLAGNLCRCTGYAPIVRAAVEAESADIPEWIRDDLRELKNCNDSGNTPMTVDQLAAWCLENPEGTLIHGATEVGLTVTKELKPLGKALFLTRVRELATIAIDQGMYRIGAGVSIMDFDQFIAEKHPSFSQMLKRFGSVQVRNSGTIGGNIANGSPIADTPPALIALGAWLHLRKGGETREIALEDYYVSYGNQDREPGEFIEAVSIPKQADRLKCYKISKRFDQDISAVLGCFSIELAKGKVTAARVAFGGMAGTVKRALAVEKALEGQNWDRQSVDKAMELFSEDFQPLSDARASSDYRLEVSQNMLLRYFQEDQGVDSSVLEVAP